MTTLEDLGFVKDVANSRETVYSRGRHSIVFNIMSGGYSTDISPISTKLHEAITQKLFTLGMYTMIGRHLKTRD